MKTEKIMVLKAGGSAIHNFGNLKRDHDAFIIIDDETEENYIGKFVQGFGFFGIKFPKNGCRSITNKEYAHLNNVAIVDTAGRMIGGIIKIDENGYFLA